MIFQSLQSLWLQDFPSLRGCFSIKWSESVLFLVHDIRASVYSRNVKQISEAYSVLSFKTLCEMLMLDRQEAEDGAFQSLYFTLFLLIVTIMYLLLSAMSMMWDDI